VILSTATFSNYENSNLKIFDLKSIAKLKIVALIMREKSRDLFDFGAILENDIFNKDELVYIFSQVDSKIILVDELVLSDLYI